MNKRKGAAMTGDWGGTTAGERVRRQLYGLIRDGLLSYIDVHFARFMARCAEEDSRELFLASALASSVTRQGHICLDLESVAGGPLCGTEGMAPPVCCPELDAWRAKLRETTVVGHEGDCKPLILDTKGRLYLYRYWQYQQTIARYIGSRIGTDVENVDTALLKEGLGRLFPEREGKTINWQKVAACVAVMKKFCVISGGPGTGKTATVAAILALLLEQAVSDTLRIALAAPTGKAAARLQEAIGYSRDTLNCSRSVRDAIPHEASTIHRLLRSIRGTPYFRHNDKNTLPIDVLVVDEASMVDLPLMAKLVQALPVHARVILLGDKDQLASVEAGSVLGDMCDTGNPHRFSERFRHSIEEVTGDSLHEVSERDTPRGLNDCIVQLQESYRFKGTSGIGTLSSAVNAADEAGALEILNGGVHEDISWYPLPSGGDVGRTFCEAVTTLYGRYLKTTDPAEAFQRFNEFRILCAVREGPFGVDTLNAVVENILRQSNLITTDGRWYRGRPLLILRNDYHLNLFNGDVGIILPDPDSHHELRAFFPESDGTMRRVHPLRLPEHETVYATTVHKSQGSEFARVFLILPDRYVPVATRELIYTGITRAREKVTIFGSEKILCQAISRRIERKSGLRDALWER